MTICSYTKPLKWAEDRNPQTYSETNSDTSRTCLIKTRHAHPCGDLSSRPQQTQGSGNKCRSSSCSCAHP
jgi:hypothetical protein